MEVCLSDYWRGGEAVRDLCRARDDAREDLQRCRHRLGKLLLRRGLHYGGRNWTRVHRQWVDSLPWAHSAERVVVDDYLFAIDQVEARLVEFDARLTATAQAEPYRDSVGWLRCFRGIDTLTAILILAELHDFRRFQSPRALMAYLGLVPGEDSTGEKHRRGRITRTGNALVRRLLPIGHLTTYLNPDVQQRLGDSNQLRDVHVLALLSRAFRRRRKLENEFNDHELEQLLWSKWLDPIGASLATYERVRRNNAAPGSLLEVATNMNNYFTDFPDTAPIQRLAGAGNAGPHGVPLFLDGLRAFGSGEIRLPYSEGLLDFTGPWTSWRVP